MNDQVPSLSKISSPVLPNIVKRKRLFNLLDDKKHYKVTWLSGMAGAGKTTLVASFLENKKRPYLWFRMDQGDADLPTFFYYLGMAVKHALPDDPRPMPLLTPEYYMGLPVFMRRYFEELCSRFTSPSCIIFDNFQDVPQKGPFHNLIKEGFESISPHIHIIIISRTDPPPSMAGMLANNEIRVLGKMIYN